MVAFANSALANKPGILYVGVNDKGEVLQDKAAESWQHDITAWGNGCFPELSVIPRTLRKDRKEFLAVVVPLSEARPHFARPAFKRQGARTIAASQQEIDEWIAYRNSKARLILEWKDRKVTVRLVRINIGRGMFTEGGEHTVIGCNSHFVTLFQHQYDRTVTHPLSAIDLKMDDEKSQLMLLLTPYF
jgi:hypothetical protein